MDIHSDGCSGDIDNMVCQDLIADPFTWIDGATFEVQGLTGIDGWEQVSPDRWRFFLRPGITFHNGERWNAAAAKFGIDLNGTGVNGGGFSQHSFVEGEVVDDLTVDVLCQTSTRESRACPIFPRQAMSAKFAAPEWYTNASDGEKARTVVSNGPYKSVRWEPGSEVRVEAFEDYQPKPDVFATTYPAIPNVQQVWRSEPSVRAAMISAGEADWAADIGFEQQARVPKLKSGTNNEVYIYTIDTVHHPELRKREVREALALAIDCPTLMEQIFDGLTTCHTNLSPTGTVGITAENSAPYPHDPQRARKLLAEANYNEANDIRLSIRSNRAPREVEYAEAVVTFWREVGINAELNVVESSGSSDLQLSSCGNQRTREDFENAPGADLNEKCRNLRPRTPYFASRHIVESATSTESLDYSRQAVLHNSCYSLSSGVCFQDLEELIEEAIATPAGNLRRQRLEVIGNRVHDDFYFYPNFQIVQIYGMSANLEWDPHYAQRIRVNTMYFTQ